VADAVEALGQDVQQEPPDELVAVQGHRLPALGTFSPIVLPAEGDATVVGRDQPAIGDGDAVCVTREVAQHLFGAAERVLAVDHPLDVAQRPQEPLEGLLVGKAGEAAEALQAAGSVGVGQQAYVLMCALRRIALAGTELECATCATLRLRLLKICVQVTVSVRRVKIALATSCPWRDLFNTAHERLSRAAR
jgi:hypothetical protein